MKLPPLSYLRPDTLEAALEALAGEEARAIAGGQSLMPMLAFRLAAPERLVDISRLAELRGVTVGKGGVRIGAGTRWAELMRDAALAGAQPLLAAALPHVAHGAIRNRGTVGGSLAHADPAAELPAVALALDGVVEIASAAGRRELPVADLFEGPLLTTLAPGELIVALRLPAWGPGRRFGFDEVAMRKGDFAFAGVALHYAVAGGRIAGARIAALGVGDTPVRLAAAEAALEGARPGPEAWAAAEEAAGEVDPPGDLHAGGRYRRALVRMLVRRLLETTETTETADG